MVEFLRKVSEILGIPLKTSDDAGSGS